MYISCEQFIECIVKRKNRIMSNFTQRILIIFSVLYFVIISLVIKTSFFDSTVVKDIASITSSFFTIIIAMLLYDRFGYRKIIYEKKLELVLKLLEKLKATTINIAYKNLREGKAFYGQIYIDKKQIDFKVLENNININSFVIFHLGDIENYFSPFNILVSNPYMPKEIVKKLEFLNVNHFEGVKENLSYQNENIKISVYKPSISVVIPDLDDWYKMREDMSIATFINNYLDCLNSIEEWINKHSNIKSDLNI